MRGTAPSDLVVLLLALLAIEVNGAGVMASAARAGE
jgi:hypothetical protein